MKPKIPIGWRKLRKGTVIKKGDKCLFDDGKWDLSGNSRLLVSISSECFYDGKPFVYIRRKGER